MSEQSRRLTASDIARLAEVSVSAVSNWRKRHADFPQPEAKSGLELFAAGEVARWLEPRKIAASSLRLFEEPGTTYGDRFIRNGGIPAQDAEVVKSSPEQAEDGDSWTSRLLPILNLLRNGLEPVSAADFLMAMLYLRTTNEELWRAVAAAHSWRAVTELLREDPYFDRDVPLFVAAAADFSGEQHLIEAIRLFDQIHLEGSGLTQAFDELLERTNRDLGGRDEHFTPSSVVGCMIGILDPQPADSVYDPSCGSGELLVAAAQGGVESLHGQAMNAHSLRLTRLNLLIHDRNAELRLGVPELRGAFAGRKFDVILSNPPFGMTLPDHVVHDDWPFGEPGKNGSNFAWLQIAAHMLGPRGRAAVLMPNGSLFSGGADRAIRSRMVEAGVVEGIIALPAGLFAATSIPVSLWIIRRPPQDQSGRSEILFIDAMSSVTTSARGRRILSVSEITRIVEVYGAWRDSLAPGEFAHSHGFARSVRIEEIRRDDYNLQPRRYIGEAVSSDNSSASFISLRFDALPGELDELIEQAERTRYDVDDHLETLRISADRDWIEIYLGDLCKIQAGPGAVDRERGLTVDGWTPLVLPRNIKRGYLSHDELDTVGPDTAKKLANYRLEPGDIVCARSGTLGRFGLIQGAEYGWLLGPSCMRLRPFENEIVPAYLVHYLNSPEVGRWITSRSQGSTAIPHISVATMRELAIPVPPVALQHYIAETMDSIDVQIAQYQREASTVQSLRDLVFPWLMR